MQKDFIDGALANPAAAAIVDSIRREIEAGGYAAVIFTQDDHDAKYAKTQEGEMLPIPHCIHGTPGCEIEPSLIGTAYGMYHAGTMKCAPKVVVKHSFGTRELPKAVDDVLYKLSDSQGDHTEITFVGTCTDICVVSNALILKAAYPDAPIFLKRDLCAGTTPENHQAAITVMKSCQIIVE